MIISLDFVWNILAISPLSIIYSAKFSVSPFYYNLKYFRNNKKNLKIKLYK